MHKDFRSPKRSRLKMATIGIPVFILILSQTIQVCLSQTTSELGLTLSPELCTNFLCQNGGSCVIKYNYLVCECLPGYFGPQCEYNSDPCYNYNCLNGGDCVATGDVPHCVCPPGYSGLRCETRYKPQCPELKNQTSVECSGVSCSSSASCPKGQICCLNECGGRTCTEPQSSVQKPTCPKACPPGYTCEYQARTCALGQICPPELVPTCVEPNDNCGGCPTGQFCKDVGTRCSKLPCLKFQCVTMDACGGCPKGQKCDLAYPPCASPLPCESNSTMPCFNPECKPIHACVPDLPEETPKDACGKCPFGLICKPTRIVCTKEQCPSYECVSRANFTVAETCSQDCGTNRVCLFKIPDCPAQKSCATSKATQCIPRENLLGSCPRVAQADWTKPCLMDRYKPQCFNDMHCNRSKQRCCPSQCNRYECKDVLPLDNTP